MNRHIALLSSFLLLMIAFSSGDTTDHSSLVDEINKQHQEHKPNVQQQQQHHVKHQNGHKSGHHNHKHHHHQKNHKNIKSSVKRPLKNGNLVESDLRRVRVVNLPDNWDRNPALFQTYKYSSSISLIIRTTFVLYIFFLTYLSEPIAQNYFQMPVLTNGYVGTVVKNDSLYVNGTIIYFSVV